MFNIAGAVFEHSLRLMFFRHDGTGLPEKKGPALYLILATTLLARSLRDMLSPEGFNPVVSIVASIVFGLMALLLFRAASMAALLLASLFGYLVMAAVYLAGINIDYLDTAILVWEAFAVFAVLNKIVARARANHKNQKSSKN